MENHHEGGGSQVCCLDKTQKEAHGVQPPGIGASRRGRRDDAPDDHAGREVDGGLSDFVEEQVGRDLHQQVSDEQDADGRLELDRAEFQVSLQTGETSGGDVVSVAIRQPSSPLLLLGTNKAPTYRSM